MEVWKSVGKQNLYGIGIKISVKLNLKKNTLLEFVVVSCVVQKKITKQR